MGDEPEGIELEAAPGGEAPAAARLRTATEAARQARTEREQESQARVRVPSRHAPEAEVKPLTMPEAPSLAPAQPQQSAPPPKTALRPEIADDPLPLAYGDDRITLLCKDPYWLHAYWEITEPTQRRTLESLGAQKVRPILRLHHYPSAAAADSDGSDDVGVSDWRMGHEYVHCGRPDAAFEIEIGFKAEDGRFVPLARSKRVSTPRDRMSDVIDDEWALAHGEQELARASARDREEMSSQAPPRRRIEPKP